MFKKILAATDGSDHGSLAVQLAADLAEKYGARLILLNVVDDRELTPEEQHLAEIEYSDLLRDHIAGSPFDQQPRGTGLGGIRPVLSEYASVAARIHEAIGAGILQKAREIASDKGVKDIETRVEIGDAAPAILSAAKDSGADLIVLGSRGLSDLRGLMLGSVSHKVANLAEIPVVTVK